MEATSQLPRHLKNPYPTDHESRILAILNVLTGPQHVHLEPDHHQTAHQVARAMAAAIISAESCVPLVISTAECPIPLHLILHNSMKRMIVVTSTLSWALCANSSGWWNLDCTQSHPLLIARSDLELQTSSTFRNAKRVVIVLANIHSALTHWAPLFRSHSMQEYVDQIHAAVTHLDPDMARMMTTMPPEEPTPPPPQPAQPRICLVARAHVASPQENQKKRRMPHGEPPQGEPPQGEPSQGEPPQLQGPTAAPRRHLSMMAMDHVGLQGSHMIRLRNPPAEPGTRLGSGSGPEGLMPDWQLKRKFEFERARAGAKGLGSGKYKIFTDPVLMKQRENNAGIRIRHLGSSADIKPRKVRVVKRDQSGGLVDGGEVEITAHEHAVRPEDVYNPREGGKGGSKKPGRNKSMVAGRNLFRPK
jgi:hypothetical protein